MTLWALSYCRKDDHDDYDHRSFTTNVTKDLDNAFISQPEVKKNDDPAPSLKALISDPYIQICAGELVAIKYFA